MSKQQMLVFSKGNRIGSFGWRHQLAWRQLSILWQIPVSNFSADNLSKAPNLSAAAFSISIDKADDNEQLLDYSCKSGLPSLLFLNQATLCRREGADLGFTVKTAEYYSAPNRWRHRFRLMSKHPILNDLPPVVDIYGECPTVTPLRIDNDMEVLLSLDGVPVIAQHGRSLIIGADAWQLGEPSVPMLYKIISNWLKHEVGLDHRTPAPCAYIRLDDLPSTAEDLKLHPPTTKLDKKRCRTIRRLRKFGERTKITFTLMFSSHFRHVDGKLTTIGSVMPRSISEIKLGVREGVFEIGAHGMVHLRDGTGPDPREFIDLDEHETKAHFDRCDHEIDHMFGVSPKSFVAPAWGYRPGVTKRIAASSYSIIVDSSQHVESGDCDVFFTAGRGANYFNAAETFRSGERMLTYSNPEFWQCYAGAGIPIHYMQHTDGNWDILKSFLKGQVDSRHKSPHGRLRLRLLRLIDDTHRPTYLRAACATLLSIMNCSLEPSSWGFLWRVLTQSSLYSFAQAMKAAGYKSLTLTALMQTPSGDGSCAVITTPGQEPLETGACR